MQKFMWLKLNRGKLLTEGFWKSCRNPNYFGELLIYSSFLIMACHWFPVLWLGIMISMYWFPHMNKKEQSLSRYEEFKVYKSQSAFFIPYVW